MFLQHVGTHVREYAESMSHHHEILICLVQWRTQNFVHVRGGGSTNSVEDRGQGSGGGSPLVRGSGGSCNFVQEISLDIVKSSEFLVL